MVQAVPRGLLLVDGAPTIHCPARGNSWSTSEALPGPQRRRGGPGSPWPLTLYWFALDTSLNLVQ